MTQASKTVARVAKDIEAILTSPLSRARETAEIVAKAFDGKIHPDVEERLLSGASVADYAETVRRSAAASLLLVAHEPDLGAYLASLLNAPGHCFPFKKGGLACVETEGRLARLVFFAPNAMLR